MRFMNRFPSLLTLAWLPAVLLLAPTNAFAANTNAAITVSLVGDVPGNSATYTIEVTNNACLLYTSPSPRDVEESRMPSSA